MDRPPKFVLASAEMYLRDLQTRMEKSMEDRGLSTSHELEALHHFHDNVQACEQRLSQLKDGPTLRKLHGLLHQLGEAEKVLQTERSMHEVRIAEQSRVEVDTTTLQDALDKINLARGRPRKIPSLVHPSVVDNGSGQSAGRGQATTGTHVHNRNAHAGRLPPVTPAAMAAVRAQVESLHRSLLLERPAGSAAGTHSVHAGETSEEVQAEAGALMQDMEKMVEALKEGGHALHDRLVTDNSMLDSTNEAAQWNLDATGKANAILEAENRGQMLNLCATFGMLATVVLIFVGCYVGLKIFSKPPPYEWGSFSRASNSVPSLLPSSLASSSSAATASIAATGTLAGASPSLSQVDEAPTLQAHPVYASALPDLDAAKEPLYSLHDDNVPSMLREDDVDKDQRNDGRVLAVDKNGSTDSVQLQADGSPVLSPGLVVHHDGVQSEAEHSSTDPLEGRHGHEDRMDAHELGNAQQSVEVGDTAAEHAGAATIVSDSPSDVPTLAGGERSSQPNLPDGNAEMRTDSALFTSASSELEREPVQVRNEASGWSEQADKSQETDEFVEVSPFSTETQPGSDQQEQDASTTAGHAEPPSASPAAVDLQPGEFQPFVHGLGMPQSSDDLPPPQVQGAEDARDAVVVGA